MTINSLLREPGRGRALWCTALTVAVVGLSITSAHAAAGSMAPNKHTPSDSGPVPGLLQDQQSRYHHLANDIWNARHIPSGLPGPSRPARPRDSGVAVVGLSVHDVDFELADGVGFHVKSLAGAMVPHHAGDPVNFDDPSSYDIHIYSGTVVIRPDELDALFNRYVLTFDPRSLSSVANHTSDDTLTVDVGARLLRFIPPVGGLPVELSGPVHIDKDNNLVYTPTSVKSLGLPLLALIQPAGLGLGDLTPLSRPGVTLSGNKLIMNPEKLFPDPRLKIDHIKSATLDDNGLTLVFSSDKATPKFAAIPAQADSYIWLQSGDAKFFSTLLVNTHLLLRNEHGHRLHFHLYHYRAQTAAGRIENLKDGSLIVSVPNQFDIDDQKPSLTQNAKPDYERK